MTAFLTPKRSHHARYAFLIAGMVGLCLFACYLRRPSPGAFDYQRGRNLEDIGLWSQAQQAFLQSIHRDPTYPPPYRALADIAMKARDYNSAVSFWRQYVHLLPYAKHAWCRLAKAEALNGWEVSAQNDAQHELLLDPNCPRAHLCLGILAAERSDALPALKHLAIASKSYANDPQIQLTYAKVLALVGEYNHAESVLRHILQLTTSHPEPYYWLGYVCARRSLDGKSLEQAERFLRTALLLNPSYPDANYELGRLYFNEHRFLAALPYLQNAIKEKPHYIAALYTLAQTQILLGKKSAGAHTLAVYQRESMLKATETALLRRYAVEPNNLSILLQLGQLEIERHEPIAALLFLQKAAKLKPNDPQIQNELNRALTLQNQTRGSSNSS